jgi:hypothetical protein
MENKMKQEIFDKLIDYILKENSLSRKDLINPCNVSLKDNKIIIKC